MISHQIRNLFALDRGRVFGLAGQVMPLNSYLLRDLNTQEGTFLDHEPDNPVSEIELAHGLTLHLGRGDDGARFRVVAV